MKLLLMIAIITTIAGMVAVVREFINVLNGVKNEKHDIKQTQCKQMDVRGN